MNKAVALGKTLLLLGLLSAPAVRINAQIVPPLADIKSQEKLTSAISKLDAALFDAYNRCDLDKFKTYIADDVEFYHDKGGVTLGREKLAESVQKNICGSDVRRELVPGTLEVYPMQGYGAVEIGVHRFLHPKSRSSPGEAKFIHLWQYKEGAWKITRVISFDHHEEKQ